MREFYTELQNLTGRASPSEYFQAQVDWLWQEIAHIKGSVRYLFGVNGKARVREKMASWRGETVDGRYFGSIEKVFLPQFDPDSFGSFNLCDLGLMPAEIDIYAEYVDARGQSGIWAVEVCRQNRPVNLTDAMSFQQKVVALQKYNPAQGWMVSWYGFNKDAINFLAQNKIYYSISID